MDVHALCQQTLKAQYEQQMPRLWLNEIKQFMHGTNEVNPNDPRNKTDLLYVKQVGTVNLKSGFKPGDLIRSFSIGDQNNIWEILKSDYTWDFKFGSKLPYAAIHEYGGQTGRGHAVTMPKRPYLMPATKIMQEKIMPMLAKNFMNEVLKQFNYNLKKEFGKAK